MGTREKGGRVSQVSIGAFVFQMGGGASLLGCVCAPWGALVLMEGGISKKNVGWGDAPPLTMGNPVNYIYQKLE